MMPLNGCDMLDLWHEFLRLFTELDVALGEIMTRHGAWTYAILFAIVFAETGLVVTPFLPGDSYTALKIVQAFAPLQAFLWVFASKNLNFRKYRLTFVALP